MMQQIEALMGLPLEDALDRLHQRGIEPEIIRIAGWREAAEGSERVIRVNGDGTRLTVARFPDRVGK